MRQLKRIYLRGVCGINRAGIGKGKPFLDFSRPKKFHVETGSLSGREFFLQLAQVFRLAGQIQAVPATKADGQNHRK